MIVRISRGTFDPARYDEVAERLDASQAQLIPAITTLTGETLVFMPVLRASNSIVNLSIWETIEHAKQMDSLAPMLALAGEFQELGVQFERPITDYETLWTIPVFS